MARTFLVAVLCWGCAAAVAAHNIGVTPITWNREISRLIYDKCASCHRPEGSAFSLMTYRDVQPRVTEIKAAVLSRRMPPWGAIKGFGDFRNDEALTPEQIELFVDWIQNDAPRGNNRQALPAEPKFSAPAAVTPPAHVVSVSGSMTLDQPLVLDGLMPRTVPPGSRCASRHLFPTARCSRCSGCTTTTNGFNTHFCCGNHPATGRDRHPGGLPWCRRRSDPCLRPVNAL